MLKKQYDEKTLLSHVCFPVLSIVILLEKSFLNLKIFFKLTLYIGGATVDLISSSGGKDNGPDGKEEFGRYIVSGCHLAMLNVKSEIM